MEIRFAPPRLLEGETYFVPSSLRLRELRLEKAVLSARPDAFRACSERTELVDPRMYSSIL